jgi:guanosine-3',5'-bis(diphosphate) 3'-pyrophosphohydrolase
MPPIRVACWPSSVQQWRRSNGNIVNIATVERQKDFTELVMEIEVEDLKRLTQILAALRSLAVVDRAVRDQEGEDDQ